MGGGKALRGEEEAIEWMRKLGENVDALCFEAVGVSVDDLRGVEWLNSVGRRARVGCVIPNMQKEDDVKSVRGMMNDPKCIWLQVDVGGGGWAPCDAPVAIDDGYVAAGGLVGPGVAAGGSGEPPAAPQVALTIRDAAGDLGLPWDDGDDDSGSDVDMGSSPLAAKSGRGVRGSKRAGAGPLVEPVVLFPAVPVSTGGWGAGLGGGLSRIVWMGTTRTSGRCLMTPLAVCLLRTPLVEEAAGLAGANALAWKS